MFKLKFIGGGVLAVLLGAGLTTVTYSMIADAPVNVVDKGADKTGTNNSQPAIALAVTAAAGKTLFFPDGTYKLNSNVTVPSNVLLHFGNVSFTGAGTLQGSGAPATFGLDPGIDTTQWGRAITRIGLTDVQNGIDLFGLNVHLKVNNVVGASNFEKGGLFLRVLDNDTTSTATNRAVVGYDSLAQIAAANTNGQIWSGVNRFQIDATGDGSAYGIEFDATNNGTAVNNHGDSGLKTKIPIWVASFGSQPSSWMFDSAAAGPGFQNGISIRDIVGGGMGIELPNNIGSYWRNQANNADVRAVIVDTSNNLVLGGSNNAGIFLQVGGAGVGSNTGAGWTNMTLSAPSMSDVTMSSTKNSGQCTLNGGSPATCTATVLSGSKCVATPNGTTAAAATHTVATSVTTTTLTVTGANGLVDVVNYHCF